MLFSILECALAVRARFGLTKNKLAKIATNEKVLNKKQAPMPKLAMIIPASAGPKMRDTLTLIELSATAFGTRARFSTSS